MPDFQLTTPVAFIIFNRPDTTERVFAEIAKAKPPKLLVVGDGARTSREGEAIKVAATRAIIDRVDWPCEVLTNFSEINLGCKRRVSSGLDWVFEQVEEAIILEDDCLPHPSFFRFCEEMLLCYRNDQRVAHINGNNLHFGKRQNNDSYYFSCFVHVWGWASWRDRWQNDYDVSMTSWPHIRDENRVEDWTANRALQKYLINVFELCHLCKVDTWDYQWSYGARINGRLSVLPNGNLISNIGFGLDATHTVVGDSVLANMLVEEMNFPLNHPHGVFASRLMDEEYATRFLIVSLFQRVINKIKRLLRS